MKYGLYAHPVDKCKFNKFLNIVMEFPVEKDETAGIKSMDRFLRKRLKINLCNWKLQCLN